MRLLHVAICAVLALGALSCSDDGNQSNNNNTNNVNNTNNTNNTNNNNTIVGDACMTNEDCTQPEDRCDGDVAIAYTGDGLCSEEFGICNYQFVQTTTDCAASTQSCENGACVDNACTNLDCTAPDDFCTGNVLTFYPEDGECNLDTAACEFESFTTNCVDEGGECMFGTCIGPCVGVMCDMPPAATCQGTVAVTYPAMGMCNMVDGTCAYAPMMMECADTQQVCVNGACVNDPCLNVQCPQPNNVCENNMAKVYSGTGVCEQANGMCNYAAVETVTDCGADLCVNAACVNVTPAAGELVITEVMHNPEAVDDTLGEWFEITNSSNRDLNLDGLMITSANDVGYTVQLGQVTLLAAGESYVFGINGDMGTNGAVPVDSAYTDIVLDATDDLGIMAGAVMVDTVAWDDMTWPATAGAAMQFGSNYDLVTDDNATATFWCDATTALGTDFGTPGAANGTCN